MVKLKRKLLKLALIPLALIPDAQAAKFDFMLGMFSLTATTTSGDTNVSSLGSYRAAFSRPILDQLDAFIGYTLNMSNTVGGDLGYGLDIGCNYFPFTFTESKILEKEGLTIRRDEIWRPYAGISFNQRQFQSVKNSYAGFGVNAGTEYSLNKNYSLKAEIRYISLAGSSESEATEINVLAGVSLKI